MTKETYDRALSDINTESKEIALQKIIAAILLKISDTLEVILEEVRPGGF